MATQSSQAYAFAVRPWSFGFFACAVLCACSWKYAVDPNLTDGSVPDTRMDGSATSSDADALGPGDGEVCPGAVCGGKCLDTSKDPDNCGACGKVCGADETCVSAKCEKCAGGRVRCGAECVDLSSDDNHCGACDAPCGASAKCVAGACVCDAPTTKCGKKCVDLSSDENHCGACDVACKPGDGCFSGKCEIICAPPTTRCSGVCVDTDTDPSNCGACGTVCISEEDCLKGACRCKTGLTKCGAACVDTNVDASNCGACGTKCTLLETCTSGSCTCKTGLTKCSGTCVDTKVDKANCGTCGTTCTVTETCTAGVCKPINTYTQSFTAGATAAAQCTAWNTFRAGISAGASYTQITLKGSLDATGVVCSGASANTLCQALRTGTATASISCGARFWRVGTCGAGIEINANNNLCACSVGYTVRPCIGNANWGGITTSSCSAPTQTMTVICE